MAETLSYNPEFNDSEFDEQMLQQVARECGLNFDIPKDGTTAQKRLIEACRIFTEEAKKIQFNSLKGYSNAQELSKRNWLDRREAHNRLCVMAFGTSWGDTDHDLRDKICDFAAIIGGRSDLSGTFH